jgi:hypothetical protein
MHLNYLFPGQEISFVFYIIRQGLQKKLAIAKSHVVPTSGRNQACHIGTRLQQMAIVIAVRPPEGRLHLSVQFIPYTQLIQYPTPVG